MFAVAATLADAAPLTINILNAGQGDCALVQCPNGDNIMIDCGSSARGDAERIGQRLTELLGADGEINTLVVTHPDADHVNYLAGVVGDRSVHSAILSMNRAAYVSTDVGDEMITWLEARPDAYEISFVDQRGERRYEIAGTSVRAARQLLAQRRREVSTRAYEPPASRLHALTLDAYAAHWLHRQERSGIRTADDQATHYHLHVAPVLGAMRMAEIRPRHVAQLVETLKGGHLSAKSVRNVHGTLHTMLERAVFEERIVANPAHLPRGMLPRASKKKRPRFTREELWSLCTDERIPEWRRVFYTLMSFTGMRLGEASGRRWRDLDASAQPLQAVTVDSQYDGLPLKTSRDDDTAERLVPVHTELARALGSWRLNGFQNLYGVAARQGHWIAADPKTGAPRTQNQAVKALYRDCDRIGVRRLGCHAFRHAFISLARSDGARKDVLESVTHNAAGEVIDGYTS